MKIRDMEYYVTCLDNLDPGTRHACRCYYFATLWMHFMELKLEKGYPLKDIIKSTLRETETIIDASDAVVRIAFSTVVKVWEYGDELMSLSKVIFPEDKE